MNEDVCVVIRRDEGLGFACEITGDYTAHERILIERVLRREFRENTRKRYQRMNREKELLLEKEKAENGRK